MKLRKIAYSLCLLAPLSLLPLNNSFALDQCVNAKPVLDTINYQISSEVNVETTKAEVFVTLNATINSSDLASIQGQAKNDLNGVVKNSQWMIESYSQDKAASGLINVSMVLKDRLSSMQLAKLTDSLSALNTQGKQYKIDHINYQPSLAQIQEAKNTLRLKMIQDVTDQLSMLNKQTNQAYHIHEINFTAPNYTPQPRANIAMMAYQDQAQSKSVLPMTVATKLVLTADVEFAKNN